MKRSSQVRHALAWVAVGGLCLPVPAAYGEEAAFASATTGTAVPGAVVTRDVALLPGGLLTGQVLDKYLKPVSDAEVSIYIADTIVAATQTDACGNFAVAGLRGGLHQVATPSGTAVCRLWAPGTAPPCATNQLAIVDDQFIVRGQAGPRFREEFFPHAKAIATHPLVIGGLIAAAIAIPTALHNADRAPGS